ncbi:hypothetical protein DVK44_17855 [Streptomyces paludis]|uniref:Transposase IS4-like domain-containing protein n=1 Tax=Streptomyces paludis TaxID=2282738 RepID=A0A345HR91_9ACTN|nr:hypothetical protein DVK44_17855 [Streptomyces paludis]
MSGGTSVKWEFVRPLLPESLRGRKRLEDRRCRRGPKRGLRNTALGRSRGGLTSKIHLACDAVGRPLAFTLIGGNTNDCTPMDVFTSTHRAATLAASSLATSGTGPPEQSSVPPMAPAPSQPFRAVRRGQKRSVDRNQHGP